MSRRRYVSTDISTDKAVNRLATQHGDFAALFYTWLIPHAEDDATFPADPEELLMKVCPGRRDKEIADIQGAIEAMLELGLIEQTSNYRRLKIADWGWQPRQTSCRSYREWRGAVLERDGYTCRECGASDVVLCAHHVHRWVDDPDLRLEVSNGITLCRNCHLDAHRRCP